MKNDITAMRIKEMLNYYNMTQQELSDKTGISKASISQYINGSHAPGNKTAQKLAKVFNVDPLWLMGFDVAQRQAVIDSVAEDVEMQELIRIYKDSDDVTKQMVWRILQK